GRYRSRFCFISIPARLYGKITNAILAWLSGWFLGLKPYTRRTDLDVEVNDNMIVRKSSPFIKRTLFILAMIIGVAGLALPKGALGLQDPKTEPGSGKAAGETKPQGDGAEISFSKDIV